MAEASGREIESLKRHVHALQQQRIVTDRLESRKIGKLLERYIASINQLAVENNALAGKQGYSEVTTTKTVQTNLPPPQLQWARSQMRQQERWLESQCMTLESWLEKPKPPKKARKKCGECGRGVGNGHRFCAGCGSQL